MFRFQKLVPLFFLLSLLLLFYSCIGDSSVAGGAGAGNPVVLTMSVKGDRGIDGGVGKTAALHSQTNEEIFIEGFDRRRIDIFGAYILVNQFRFPLPTDAGEKHLRSPLYASGNEIVLPGPYTFDLLNGNSISDVNFSLPHGTYDYLVAQIEPVDSGKIDTLVHRVTKGYQIALHGEINYEGILRTIFFYIYSDTAVFIHPPEGDSISLDGSETVELVIELDEKQWLEGISIKSIVENGLMQTDEDGNFYFIGDPSRGGPSNRKAEQIRKRILDNITRSGVLIQRAYEGG